jgi:hypothetical protein
MNQMAEKENHEDENYRAYLEQRQFYNEKEFEMSERYDKWILTLSGGSLAVSLTFLEKFGSNPIPWTKALLGGCWLLLLVTIICGLSSFLTSQSAFRRQRDILDDSLDDKAKSNQRNCLACTTNGLNIASLICFIAAVAFLCAFALVNMP